MYQRYIREILAKNGYVGKYDPRHIEAWMRLEHSTLDGLSRDQFNDEVFTAMACIDATAAETAIWWEPSEQLAKSYGL